MVRSGTFDVCSSRYCYELVRQTQKTDLTATHCLPPRDRNYGANIIMVTSVLPSLELGTVAAMLCCKDYRYSCGASMVTFWEGHHTNPNKLEVNLSYHIGVHQSKHASIQ